MSPSWFRIPLLFSLCLAGTACDGFKPSKTAIVDATILSCQRSDEAKQGGLDCNCLVKQLVADMSPEEVQLWARDPNLFDGDELQLLMMRKAIPCMKPQLVAGCVKGGGWQSVCECVATQYVETFTGEQLDDLRERMMNGSAVNPEAARIRGDCVTRNPKPRAYR